MSDRRPLVAHVVHRFAVGGLENGVVNLINRSPDWRHAVVAMTEVDAAFASRIQRADVAFHSMHKPPGSGLKLYGALLALFRRLRPQVVHTRNLGTLDAMVPAWRAGVPVRVHGEHGWDVGDEEGSSARYRLVRRLYRPFVHHYVALSRPIGRYLHERVGVADDRIEEICNGVDTDRFVPSAGGRQSLEGSPFSDPALWVAGTVGRMQTVKDQPTLARAFVLAARRSEEARRRMRLVLAGDGPLRSAVEAILREAGLADLAWFAGERGDVPAVLRSLDCFVLPSRTEGISNTILEAAASGLPVIATRVGGNPDIVEEGRTARLVPPGDPEAIATAMLDYFTAPDVAKAHGGAGRELALRRFSLERMVAQYTGLYSRLLDRSGARALGPAVQERH